MSLHDPARHGKPDAGADANRLGGEERIEYARTDGFRNPAACG